MRTMEQKTLCHHGLHGGNDGEMMGMVVDVANAISCYHVAGIYHGLSRNLPTN